MKIIMKQRDLIFLTIQNNGIRMFTKLERRVEEHGENFNKGLENTKKTQ